MRTTILSRSLVAVAALAVGSATLSAVPATAATPSGITRESVLTAASGLRASIGQSSPSAGTIKAMRSILHRGCSVDVDNGELLYTTVDGIPLLAGSSADGLAAYGQIYNVVDGTSRECIVGVVAVTSPGYVLSGTATLTSTTDPGDKPVSSVVPLAGDVTATVLSVAEPGSFSSEPTFTANGSSTKTTVVPAKTVKDKKTTAEKKAAKKKYAKRLAAAKKKYAKALKKAGSSKVKKAAAKKIYSISRRSAKGKYRYATAGYRIVKKATTTKDVRPFTIALLML